MSNNVSLIYLIRGPGVDEFPEIGLFSIEDHQSGKIYVHRPVDREVTPSFMVSKMGYGSSLCLVQSSCKVLNLVSTCWLTLLGSGKLVHFPVC